MWDCRSKQILPNIYGFRAKINAKYETEEKISNKEFFKRKKKTASVASLVSAYWNNVSTIPTGNPGSVIIPRPKKKIIIIIKIEKCALF